MTTPTTAETATDRAAHIVNVYAFEASLRTDQWLRLRDAIATAITAAEARAEARGRTQALEEAAAVIGTGSFCRYVDHVNECCGCDEKIAAIRALASRTGEGEADSADSGEEEKRSGGNG